MVTFLCLSVSFLLEFSDYMFCMRGYVFFFGELDVGITGIGRESKPFEPSLSQLRNLAFGSNPRRIRLNVRKSSRFKTFSLVPMLYLPSLVNVRVPRLAGITQMLAPRVSSDPLTAQLVFTGWLRTRAIPADARGADRVWCRVGSRRHINTAGVTYFRS